MIRSVGFRRRLGFVLLAGLLLVAEISGAVEPTPLIDGLRDPAALTVREGPTGGYRVVIAEAGADRFIELTVLGEGILSRRKVGRIIGPRPVGLACYGERLLVCNERGLSLLPLEEGAKPGRGPVGPGPTGPPAANATWFLAPGEGGLLRGRLAAERVGDPKLFPAAGGEPLAVALSPEGYAVALLGSGEERSMQIAFYDPANLSQAIATHPVEGLTKPVALAYSASGGTTTLLALESGGEAPGLVRLVTTSVGIVRAEPLAAISDPVAMVVAPDGVPLVATADGDLLRLDHLVPVAPMAIDPPQRETSN